MAAADLFNMMIERSNENPQRLHSQTDFASEFNAIANLVIDAEDYWLQAVLLEILYRLARKEGWKNEKKIVDATGWELSIAREFLKIRTPQFETSVRNFLLQLNTHYGRYMPLSSPLMNHRPVH